VLVRGEMDEMELDSFVEDMADGENDGERSCWRKNE
jgi:hypothetical protein